MKNNFFIGKYKQDKKEKFYIYYKNRYGWDAWHRETFSPDTEDIEVLDFKITGKTYQEKKASAQDLAIKYSYNFAGLCWSYSELITITDYFYKIGKRYGLLKEFKNNCII